MRPDFLFFATEENGEIVTDLIDPHGAFLADALAKLKGLKNYAESHSDKYRQILAVDSVKGELRSLDVKNPDVRRAISEADANDPDCVLKLYSAKFSQVYS